MGKGEDVASTNNKSVPGRGRRERRGERVTTHTWHVRESAKAVAMEGVVIRWRGNMEGGAGSKRCRWTRKQHVESMGCQPNRVEKEGRREEEARVRNMGKRDMRLCELCM
jgi:hypothetical protein